MQLEGVWIPVVTPFHGSRLDLASLERLIEDLVPKGVSGLVVGATTGEALVLSEEEVAALVAFLASDAAGYISAQIISINGGMI